MIDNIVDNVVDTLSRSGCILGGGDILIVDISIIVVVDDTIVGGNIGVVVDRGRSGNIGVVGDSSGSNIVIDGDCGCGIGIAVAVTGGCSSAEAAGYH